MDNDKLRELMMEYLDGELDEAGRRSVEKHLAESEELRREFDSIWKMKEITSGLRLPQPAEEVWNMYWSQVYNRLERGTGWILLSLGAIVLLAFGVFHFVKDFLKAPQTPLAVKLGLSALLLGAIILFVSILRERLFVRKTDRYKEILR